MIVEIIKARLLRANGGGIFGIGVHIPVDMSKEAMSGFGLLTGG